MRGRISRLFAVALAVLVLTAGTAGIACSAPATIYFSGTVGAPLQGLFAGVNPQPGSLYQASVILDTAAPDLSPDFGGQYQVSSFSMIFDGVPWLTDYPQRQDLWSITMYPYSDGSYSWQLTLRVPYGPILLYGYGLNFSIDWGVPAGSSTRTASILPPLPLIYGSPHLYLTDHHVGSGADPPYFGVWDLVLFSVSVAEPSSSAFGAIGVSSLIAMLLLRARALSRNSANFS